ncbi:hypothetical protein DID74_00530 [Candidatus Marinamargulisbacteria bacterium SCGC AG-333-B06]|nr:hypothetical protein DID74_00530 [Candidatus Marinamargulisbacteria bacterium SCGC AG-333-B06]
MVKKQLAFLMIVSLFSIVMTNAIVGKNIMKVWEFDLEGIYKSTKISGNFSPVLNGDKLVFGDIKGEVKTFNIKTKKIEKILKLPISIDKSLEFKSKILKDFVVFSGKHLTNGKHYFCSIDIKKKRIKGVVSHKDALLSFGEFALFEKNKNFIIFNPKEGRGVYRQRTTFNILKPIYTQDYNRYVFQSKQNEVIDIEIPNFGASLIMSKRTKQNDILKFTKIIAIDEDVIADNIDESILYFHRKSGLIGLLDIDKKKIIWEKKYFNKHTKIQGPYVEGKTLFYLVSYSNKQLNKGKLGKIIALNKNSGLSRWISDDLPFNNFGIMHFDQYIISSDLLGNILFLDIENGKVKDKIEVGAGVTKPIIKGKNIIIITSDKIIMLENKRIKFRLKLIGRKVKGYFT